MYKLAAVAVALALFAVPAAIAEDEGQPPEDESILEIPLVGIYVASDGLWTEENGADGLQRVDHFVDEDGNVVDEGTEGAELLEADEQLLP